MMMLTTNQKAVGILVVLTVTILYSLSDNSPPSGKTVHPTPVIEERPEHSRAVQSPPTKTGESPAAAKSGVSNAIQVKTKAAEINAEKLNIETDLPVSTPVRKILTAPIAPSPTAVPLLEIPPPVIDNPNTVPSLRPSPSLTTRNREAQPAVSLPKHSKNFSACISGYSTCDHNILDAAEAALVGASDLRRNLSACLNGYGSCDKRKLTEAEQSQVNVSDLRRNLSACLNGYGSCDKRKLTEEQTEDVNRRVLQRRQ